MGQPWGKEWKRAKGRNWRWGWGVPVGRGVLQVDRHIFSSELRMSKKF